VANEFVGKIFTTKWQLNQQNLTSSSYVKMGRMELAIYQDRLLTTSMPYWPKPVSRLY